MPATGYATKEQIVAWHTLLYRVRHGLHERGLVDESVFHAYDEHGVLPTHLFRDRRAHSEAVTLLASALDEAVGPRRQVVFQRRDGL